MQQQRIETPTSSDRVRKTKCTIKDAAYCEAQAISLVKRRLGQTSISREEHVNVNDYFNSNMMPETPKKKIKVTIQKIPKIKKALTAVDLFCGCGGMSYGLTRSGVNVLAGIDHWDRAIDTYRANNNHIGVCEDLTNYSPDTFSKEYKIKEFDILVGGPPCQGFSIAGKRDEKDPRNSLFMEYVKYLDYFRPKAFIMENVMGILSMKMANGEKVINTIIEQLSTNYQVHINKLYASDFETPQNRRRVIIVGIRKDLNIVPDDIPLFTKKKEDRPPVRSVYYTKGSD